MVKGVAESTPDPAEIPCLGEHASQIDILNDHCIDGFGILKAGVTSTV